MKILVCGNAPCLLDDLKDHDLSIYDKVVRVNDWQPIDGYDNRCDAWVYYPLNGIIGNAEYKYNFEPYLNINEHWLAHFYLYEEAKRVTKRVPEYKLQIGGWNRFILQTGVVHPTTGLWALFMALCISNDVTAVGFNFFQDKYLHYYDKILTEPKLYYPHTPSKEKVWFEYMKELGRLK